MERCPHNRWYNCHSCAWKSGRHFRRGYLRNLLRDANRRRRVVNRPLKSYQRLGGFPIPIRRSYHWSRQNREWYPKPVPPGRRWQAYPI